jgi:hypothetical protein
MFGALLASKGLGLLHELVPNAAVIALLVNPKLPESAHTVSEAQEAVRTLGRQLLVLNAIGHQSAVAPNPPDHLSRRDDDLSVWTGGPGPEPCIAQSA